MDLAQGKKKKKDDKKEDKKKKLSDAVADEHAAAVPKAQLSHTLAAEAGEQKLPYCNQSVGASISPGAAFGSNYDACIWHNFCCHCFFHPVTSVNRQPCSAMLLEVSLCPWSC